MAKLLRTPASVCVYLLCLWAWWNVCGRWFALPAADTAVYATTPSAAIATAAAATPTASATTPTATATMPTTAAASAAVSAAPTVSTPAAATVATTAAAAAARPAVTPAANCPASRRPYHVLLTAQGSIYNGWQARIMYYHWQKQRDADGPCTEMTGFTRLCASPDGEPDGLEAYIPSIFVKQLTTEVLKKYGHFGVLNRPHSVVEFFKLEDWRARIHEEYVYVAGTTRSRSSHGISARFT